MGVLVSELLPKASDFDQDLGRLDWTTQRMGARINLDDKERLRDRLGTITRDGR